jgi:hypothetical protein
MNTNRPEAQIVFCANWGWKEMNTNRFMEYYLSGGEWICKSGIF